MGDNNVRQSRRNFLKWAVISAVGIAIPLAAGNLAKDAFTISEAVAGKSSSPANSATEAANVTFLRVKAVYFQMAEYVSVNEEYFSIQNPAIVRDLLNAVLLRHPTMPPQMMASMWVLVNGSPSNMSANLRDGDEIDLIPVVAGG